MARKWVIVSIYAVLSQSLWVYMFRPLRLRRSIRLCVRLCTTHCSFCEHIAKNVFRNVTYIFSHPSRRQSLRLSCRRYAFPAAGLRLVDHRGRAFP